MANVLKKAVFNLMDKAFTQEGYVLAIRKWEPAKIYEIDLYMPETDMNKWNTIPRIKCKVAKYEYRDYTPAAWDSEKNVCTVIIETEHNGCGSSWTQNLQVGDTVLFAPAHAAQLPSKPGKIVCFGDGSAIGHFLALKQLTDRTQYPLEAVIFLNEEYKLSDSFLSDNPEFKFLMKADIKNPETLNQFSENKILPDSAYVYIAGYIPMVTGLRKMIKKNPQFNARIYANGFWS